MCRKFSNVLEYFIEYLWAICQEDCTMFVTHTRQTFHILYSMHEYLNFTGQNVEQSETCCYVNAGGSVIIQGGSNMTGTNCDLFTHK
jgi:hypothetical protein